MFRNYSKYEVYEDGRIWSYSHNKWLKPMTRKDGYKQVCLVDNEGKKKMYKLHRVVFEAVTGSPIPSNMQVNHIDERKDNNARSNLNLMSRKENVNWGTGIERSAKARINGKRSKSVGSFKDGKLIFTFPSTMECGRQGFDHSSVVQCCNGKLKTHRGFEWKYI